MKTVFYTILNFLVDAVNVITAALAWCCVPFHLIMIAAHYDYRDFPTTRFDFMMIFIAGMISVWQYGKLKKKYMAWRFKKAAQRVFLNHKEKLENGTNPL